MAFNCNNAYQKSAQTAYNNAAQAYAADGLTVNVLARGSFLLGTLIPIWKRYITKTSWK